MRKLLAIFIAFGLIFSYNVYATDTAPSAVDSNFSFVGNGSIKSVTLNDKHCGYSPEGCIAHLSGNWNTLRLRDGKITADVNIEWQHSTSNGKGGYCAPVSGSAEIRSRKSKDAITVSITGTDCDSLRSSEILPHVYRLSFVVTGGTGKFEGATGSGSLDGIDLVLRPFVFRASGHVVIPEK